jgi:HTH-type transcriptional regulator/antitoxin HigA
MITKKTYQQHLIRIEELLTIVGNDTAITDPNFIELDSISDLVADYEKKYLPVEMPSLIDVIKLRMQEQGLKQKDLAVLLGTTTSRISEYIKGKRELTLQMAKKVHKQLNIDADIILQ